jgi:hypothetical protein
VDFNQVAMVVEVDEAAIAPHLERLADVARRQYRARRTDHDKALKLRNHRTTMNRDVKIA